MKYRWIVLGIVIALIITGLVIYMAGASASSDMKLDTLDMIPRAYLPCIFSSNTPVPTLMPEPSPTPTPHRVKASLSQCCANVSCDKVWSYGAEWVSGWSPLTERCGQPSSPMIRDANQWAAIKAGTYVISDTVYPIQVLNEPENQDCAAGACISLAETVSIYHEVEAMFPDKELASPAFLPDWVQAQYDLLDFVDSYYNVYGVYPRFEVLTLHPYGTESMGSWQNSYNATASEFDTVLTELYNRGYAGLRVWLTEIGYWQNDPTGMISQMDAEFYLNAWINKCDSDSRCEYINWFGITNGSYWFVAPLEFSNGTKTLAGQDWLSRFN